MQATNEVDAKLTPVGNFVHITPKTRKVFILGFGITVAVLVMIIVILAILLGKRGSTSTSNDFDLEKNLNKTTASDVAKFNDAIKVDFSTTQMLPATPNTYLSNQFYVPFIYILPSSFVQEKRVVLKEYTVWYDEYNIEGIRFTF